MYSLQNKLKSNKIIANHHLRHEKDQHGDHENNLRTKYVIANIAELIDASGKYKNFTIYLTFYKHESYTMKTRENKEYSKLTTHIIVVGK